MRFRLALVPMTLDDLELEFSGNFALLSIFGRQQRLKEWR